MTTDNLLSLVYADLLAMIADAEASGEFEAVDNAIFEVLDECLLVRTRNEARARAQERNA